ncbi:NADH-quinone oxidoreductase subunit A [Pelobium manganitolerans]|uniref:NADH-quinone oxidoreductase subunit A n=1 Tax=Pelobium manganitolerans TaxID=1842495 RepID=UPI003FA38D8D
MEEVSSITEFGKVIIFLITGLLAMGGAYFVNHLLSPNHPNPEKNSSYECGEEPSGSSWLQFNSRFYVIALIFLLFDVEMIFVFPWATVFADPELIAADARWGWLSFTEMLGFLSILILGLVYVWRKKDLDWIKPTPTAASTDTAIPLSAYEAINKEVYVPFKNKVEPETEKVATPVVSKPKFVPRFKKA